jgi:glutathione S-transferase
LRLGFREVIIRRMGQLFHFPSSAFSARVRIALALKSVPVELVDCRADAARLAHAQQLAPTATMPVYVAGDGQVLVDSLSIVRWLDLSFPTPRLFPAGPSELSTTLRVCDYVDVALNILVDLGTRAWTLRSAPEWSGYVDERLGRAHRTLEALAREVAALDRPTVGPDGINAADIWLATLVRWFEGLPARAEVSAPAKQILSLNAQMPAALSAFAAPINAHPIVKRAGFG